MSRRKAYYRGALFSFFLFCVFFAIGIGRLIQGGYPENRVAAPLVSSVSFLVTSLACLWIARGEERKK